MTASGIHVRLPEPLRGNGGATISVHEPVSTLGELIDLLEQRVPGFSRETDEIYSFAVNGNVIMHGERDVALEDGDQIELLVAFAGG